MECSSSGGGGNTSGSGTMTIACEIRTLRTHAMMMMISVEQMTLANDDGDDEALVTSTQHERYGGVKRAKATGFRVTMSSGISLIILFFGPSHSACVLTCSSYASLARSVVRSVECAFTRLHASTLLSSGIAGNLRCFRYKQFAYGEKCDNLRDAAVAAAVGALACRSFLWCCVA